MSIKTFQDINTDINVLLDRTYLALQNTPDISAHAILNRKSILQEERAELNALKTQFLTALPAKWQAEKWTFALSSTGKHVSIKNRTSNFSIDLQAPASSKTSQTKTRHENTALLARLVALLESGAAPDTASSLEKRAKTSSQESNTYVFLADREAKSHVLLTGSSFASALALKRIASISSHVTTQGNPTLNQIFEDIYTREKFSVTDGHVLLFVEAWKKICEKLHTAQPTGAEFPNIAQFAKAAEDPETLLRIIRGWDVNGHRRAQMVETDKVNFFEIEEALFFALDLLDKEGPGQTIDTWLIASPVQPRSTISRRCPWDTDDVWDNKTLFSVTAWSVGSAFAIAALRKIYATQALTWSDWIITPRSQAWSVKKALEA